MLKEQKIKVVGSIVFVWGHACGFFASFSEKEKFLDGESNFRKVYEVIKFHNIMREVLSAKIHKVTVTEANLDYVGSITIDEDLIEKAGFWEGQKVMVVSNTSGSRLETYIIKGKKGSGIICMNGASAHLIKQGEEIIIMGFEITDKSLKSKNILVDRNNKFLRFL
jgi:aspartate 1-decarboxylase